MELFNSKDFQRIKCSDGTFIHPIGDAIIEWHPMENNLERYPHGGFWAPTRYCTRENCNFSTGGLITWVLCQYSRDQKHDWNIIEGSKPGWIMHKCRLCGSGYESEASRMEIKLPKELL